MKQYTLIFGPTASGKSTLALRLAEKLDAAIVNADALQVYDCWNVLTARPSVSDEKCAPHLLYGHVDFRSSYSVGNWLRDVTAYLNKPLIIVGGTGLYFKALCEGLADIPVTPPEIRLEGNRLLTELGVLYFQDYLTTHDPVLFARMDQVNPARLQRGWEVHKSTHRALSDWQKDTPDPLISAASSVRLVLRSDTERQNNRIDTRFDWMMENGAIEECEALQDDWQSLRPSARALGAAEIMAMLDGELSQAQAVEKAKVVTHRYAKRQRTWARSNMAEWLHVEGESLSDDATFSQILAQYDD